MTTLSFTEGNYAAEFLVTEGPNQYSRDAVTVASGLTLGAGAVLGALTRRQAAAPIPTIVGTGTGLMSALTFGPDVQVGSYVITLTATSATAAFTVVAPDGTALPTGAVATAYKSSHLSFLIADGGTMTAADKFTVVVTAAGTPVVVGATGTGTCTSITLGSRAQLGTYKVVNRAVVANGGDFEVMAPNGESVGRFLMGTASTAAAAFTSEHVNFTLTDATDFILGNYFNIIVATHTGQVQAFNPLAVDGSQRPMGILLEAVDASLAAKAGTAIARFAELKTSKLVWAATVTAAQQAAALTQLKAIGLIAR
ncbi:MAG: head decoration protein [Candidatus Contendobacter sp.]|nr:head decoration protein [Candidatus Contendobacter sp.]